MIPENSNSFCSQGNQPDQILEPELPEAVNGVNVIFEDLLRASGFKYDQRGIYQEYKSKNVSISDFSHIDYLFNKMEGGKKIRYLQIKGTIFRVTPRQLINLAEFRKLLLSANINLSCTAYQFRKLVNIIIQLDNGKLIRDTNGYGKVADHIYNYGNKILINGKLGDFRSVVWLGKKGYFLQETDMIRLWEKDYDLLEIWKSFYQLYGHQAVLIIGYALGTLYFQEYMQREKCFPLLYIKAGSGRGKNGLAELIEKIFGIRHSFSSINCAGNSTRIGIENKSILLNNLPLILNEVSEKEFQYIKSRYDGQGSVKYSDFQPGNISERTVNGPTLITTVVEPLDKQIISRCIFIDLDMTKMQKRAFERIRSQSNKFSAFIPTVLGKITFSDLLDRISGFKQLLGGTDVQPRIIDNYSLAAGCFLAFCSLIENKAELPEQETITRFIIEEMKQTESFLNPLNYFLIELERLSECSIARKFISQDKNYLYFNFNGVWSIISQAYKDRYLPFITPLNIKNLLGNSQFIARYGIDFEVSAKNLPGKPVTAHNRRYNEIMRRSFVLVKAKMPGYFK